MVHQKRISLSTSTSDLHWTAGKVSKCVGKIYGLGQNRGIRFLLIGLVNYTGYDKYHSTQRTSAVEV